MTAPHRLFSKSEPHIGRSLSDRLFQLALLLTPHHDILTSITSVTSIFDVLFGDIVDKCRVSRGSRHLVCIGNRKCSGYGRKGGSGVPEVGQAMLDHEYGHV